MLNGEGCAQVMDLRKVKKLIELAEESGIAELEVTSGDESVRITMNAIPALATSAPLPSAVSFEQASDQGKHAREPDSSPQQANVDTKPVVSPMAGTFYRAPSPQASPYVEVGDSVSAGDVVCIIESMKMMHEIRAVSGGTVESILIENGTPIGTGEALFLLS